MPTLTINKQYDDAETLTEAQLDAAFSSITTLVNTTGLGSDNIQDNSISAAKIQDNAVTESKIAANAVTTPKILDGAVTLSKLATALQAYLTPTATVASFTGDTAPTGWLLCDGSQVSRTTYADLFAAVGVRFGAGNGTTTFHVPDLRGRFIRGWDHGAGRDPEAATRTAMNSGGATGDSIGSVQGDDFEWPKLRVMAAGGGATAGTFDSIAGGNNGPTNSYLAVSHADNLDGDSTNNSTGAETRPKNVYLNFMIKT